MDKTINQIKKEFNEIATEHRQINGFFWGDFLDAISRDAVSYPLMVGTLQPGSMGDDYVSVNVQIIICDKYNESDYRQIDEVHSDCLQVCNDIRITLKQYRFEDYLSIDGDISTDPFINRGQDMTAGWTMNINLKVYDNENFCAIPYDNYDFEND
jgi:hypothetical protein